MPPNVSTFGDLSLPLFVTATDLQRQQLFIFGDDPGAPLVDAVLASASMPCIHPPVTYERLQLVDGGALANVPSSIAMDKAATTLYVVNAGYGGGQTARCPTALEVFNLTLSSMMSQSMLQDLDHTAKDDTVDLYHIHLSDFGTLSFRGFQQDGRDDRGRLCTHQSLPGRAAARLHSCDRRCCSAIRVRRVRGRRDRVYPALSALKCKIDPRRARKSTKGHEDPAKSSCPFVPLCVSSWIDLFSSYSPSATNARNASITRSLASGVPMVMRMVWGNSG